MHTNVCIWSEDRGPLSMNHLPFQMYSNCHRNSDIYHCKIPIAAIHDLHPYNSQSIPANKKICKYNQCHVFNHCTYHRYRTKSCIVMVVAMVNHLQNLIYFYLPSSVLPKLNRDKAARCRSCLVPVCLDCMRVCYSHTHFSCKSPIRPDESPDVISVHRNTLLKAIIVNTLHLSIRYQQ